MILGTVVLLNILVSVSLHAAGPADEAWEAYLVGDFDRVEQLVIEAEGSGSADTTQLARLYLTLGCADAIQGKDSVAVTSFEIALDLDPSIELSPSELPPPVWKIYESVRNRIPLPTSETVKRRLENRATTGAEPAAADTPPTATRIDTAYIFKPVYRQPSAAVKSLVFPGWGHLTEGRRKGYIFAGIEAVAVTGLVVSALETSRNRDDYLAARDPAEIDAGYDSYNRSYRMTWGFAVVTAMVYLAAQVDFFSSSPPVPVSLSIDDRIDSGTMSVKARAYFISLAWKLRM